MVSAAGTGSSVPAGYLSAPAPQPGRDGRNRREPAVRLFARLWATLLPAQAGVPADSIARGAREHRFSRTIRAQEHGRPVARQSFSQADIACGVLPAPDTGCRIAPIT